MGRRSVADRKSLVREGEGPEGGAFGGALSFGARDYLVTSGSLKGFFRPLQCMF